MINLKIFNFTFLVLLVMLISLQVNGQQKPKMEKPPKAPVAGDLPFGYEPKKDEVENETNKEIASKKSDEQTADNLLKQALQAFKNNEYGKSVKLYNKAFQILETISDSSPYLEQKKKKLHQDLDIVYYYWARELTAQAEKEIDQKKFVEAQEKLAKAKKIDPSLARRIERLIKRIDEKDKVVGYIKETSEKEVDPQKNKRLLEIDILMAQGKKLYTTGSFHRAREKFEKVLLIDPYNMPAVQMVKKIQKKMYKAGKKRFEMTVEERNSEVTWSEVTPLLPRSLEAESRAPKPIKKNTASNEIKDKLDNIIIEHMEFEEATIPAVIKALRFEAKQMDPDKEGINLILRQNVKNPTSGASKKDDMGLDGADMLDDLDLETLPGDEAVPKEGAEPGKTITIMFDDLSVGEAIRNICIAAEMKYRIEEYAVVIAGKDVPLDTLETRIYAVDSEAEFGGAVAAGGGATTSVKPFFERQGVHFPQGSEIVYDGAISRLIATNTAEELLRIERIIRELNVVDPQVLIECKFVEFRENKDDEFGIAWQLSRQHNTHYNAVTNPTDRPGNITWKANEQPLRFLNAVSTDPLNNQDVLFNVQKTTKKGLSVSAVGHAMDLEDNTNILSCPRITTQNGEEASIRMITEMYFPDSWGEPTLLDSGAGAGAGAIAQVGYVSSMPEFGEPTEIGVTLTVTPNVDPDKYTITLDMIPVVQSQVDWVDYSYVQQTSQGTVKNSVVMVIIEARTITTQVTIYDGETIVMGGIMRDRVGTTNDKWPVLGDVPLIGRFFQSQYKTSVKENLLIFTTPRLVNPNGSPLRQREVRGKPPFRM